MEHLLSTYISDSKLTESLKPIVNKVLASERISVDETIELYEKAELGLLSQLASIVCTRKNGDNIYFNKNFHIEPTNLCIYNCKFCSYHKGVNDPQSWEMSKNDVVEAAKKFIGKDVTEVHITGGVHPKWTLDYYGEMVQSIKKVLPNIHVKAFSAVELEYVIKKAKLNYREGMRKLRAYGLDSIPGGGAEIFNPEVREKISHDKASGEAWLAIHEAAHQEGIFSNATMLYGHVESYRHRAEHMDAIRSLQDKTKGFNCFIPLKFRAANNPMGYLGEVNLTEDLRNFAVSRIFFDNIAHIKAYWPMLGKENTKLALAFGVDDIDGTIDDTTKIYSMAGAEDQKPRMTVDMLTNIIRDAGKTPMERDSLYNAVREY
ncbi:MAG TPA: aminofutalosine synthase MqnE [Tenuifilaceae bacterium]|nr:aminofutalosine synthase MqnE [Tenuifilaceae bacterium]HOZ14162.1 aminofutalosine synthase MqnE [Tenuifilaceae bacterium]HPN22425.1 aminofutalosine synthase MqnE [Tenuifilaceae bacterium]